MKKKSCWLLFALASVLLTACATAPPPGQSVDFAAPPLVEKPAPEAEALWRQAEQAQKAGNTASALSLYDRIVQNHPNSTLAARALHRAGNVYLAQGQPDRAMQYYDYLIYTYAKWDGVNLARVDRLRALAALGKKKQVMKEATPLWEASAAHPEAQVALSRFMADVYRSEGETETAFEWLTVGFNVALTPEEKKSLTQATLELLSDKDEGDIKRLLRRNPSDFMRVFLEYRLAQIEMQNGQTDSARERMRILMAQAGSHPLVTEIQASSKQGPRKETPTQVALPLNPDRVGGLLPLNGPYAKYGQMVSRGLALATEEWNEQHSGQRITLVIKDAQAEPNLAVKAFQELLKNDGVIAVVGPLGAQSAKEVAPLATQWEVPLLTLTQKEDAEEDSPFVLHIFLDNRELVRTLVRHCREKLGYTRFATLYPDDRYGQKLSKIFSEVVKEMGGSVVASVSYKSKSTDFKEPIVKLMNIAKKNVTPPGTEGTPFEALFVPDQVQTVAMLAPQLPYNDVVGATLLGTNLWGEEPFVQAGGAYVEHALFATPFLPDSELPHVAAFRERYLAAYPEPPSYLEAQAYDAMMLLLEARFASSSGSVDRTTVLNNLLQIQGHHGIAGEYSFTPQGDLRRDYLLFQVMNGQLVPVAR